MSTLLITFSVILSLGLLTVWRALTIIARVWEMSEEDDRPWPENTATQSEVAYLKNQSLAVPTSGRGLSPHLGTVAYSTKL